MRMLLAWFMLTLRWLLVPTLPVLGLIAGLWLRPVARPVWERTLEASSLCASIVADEEATSLVVLRGLLRDMGTYYYALEGMDITTGKELYSTRMTRQSPVQLIAGTTLAISPDIEYVSRRLILFDWKKNINVAELPTTQNYLQDLSLYQNHVLATVPSRYSEQDFHFWHVDNEPARRMTFSLNRQAQILQVQLSSLGAWASVSYSAIDETAPSGPRYVQRMQFIDTHTGKGSQQLPDDIELVNWHPEQESFLALRRDATKNQKYWQRYDYEQGQGFHATDQIVPLIRHAQHIKQTPSPFIVLPSLATNDPWRIKLSTWLGKAGDSWLRYLWPTSTTLTLHHRITGEELNSLTVPSLNLVNLRYTVHADPAGRGLILEHQGVFAYWEFLSLAKWYPWIGLCLGMILSILVARWNFWRVTPAISSNR